MRGIIVIQLFKVFFLFGLYSKLGLCHYFRIFWFRYRNQEKLKYSKYSGLLDRDGVAMCIDLASAASPVGRVQEVSKFHVSVPSAGVGHQ